MTMLAGKVAIVTGASSGLGLRFAKVLAEQGAKVALIARRVDRLHALQTEIEAAGGTAQAFALDITDAAAIAATFQAVTAALGPPDILINNAGMAVEKRFEDYSADDFDAVMATNVKGAFFCAQALAKSVIARKAPGWIVNIASIGAHKALPGLTAYCMSKAAIAMMTKSLARDFARRDINVNAICPGYILTEINADWFATEGGAKQIQTFPRKRLGTESDLDGALLLLLGPQGRFITGSLITVDDGQSL